MIKVDIKKQNVITNSATFASQEEADLWLAREVANKSFGESERLINKIDENGNFVVDENGIAIQELLPAEFTFEIIDISEQVALEKAKSEAKQFLADSDFMVIRHLGQKALGMATSLSEEEYLQLEQQRQQARNSIA